MTEKITTIQPESKFTREFVYTLMTLTEKEQKAVMEAWHEWNKQDYWHGVNKHNIGSIVDTWVRKLTEWGGTE